MRAQARWFLQLKLNDGNIYYNGTKNICNVLVYSAWFFLRRSKLLPEQSGKTLSILETNLFLPAMIFGNLSSHFTSDALREHFTSVLAGTGMVILSIMFAKIFAALFGKERESKRLLTYIFAFPNYAYFGYPIIETVFGSEILARTIIFAIPFTITIFTYGVYLLTGKEQDKKSISAMMKSLFKPVLIAIILGVFCGMLPLKPPALISDAISMAASCMSPVSMILTGFVLAAYPLAGLFRSLKAYAVSLIRLIVIPAVFACILWTAGVRGDIYSIPVIISAMPVGMNVIVFSEADGQDSRQSARICFVSYIISLFTIPIVFGVLSTIGV